MTRGGPVRGGGRLAGVGRRGVASPLFSGALSSGGFLACRDSERRPAAADGSAAA